MPRRPEILHYETRTRPLKLLGERPASAWNKAEAVFRMFVGILPLVVGIYSLITTAVRWPDRWVSGLFLGGVALIAGYVFSVRPLYRLVKGGPWWKVE